MKNIYKRSSVCLILALIVGLLLPMSALAGIATIGDQSYTLADYTDFALPPDSGEFFFLFLGDIQFDGEASSMEVDHAAWGNLIQVAEANHPSLDFAIQVGDLMNNNNDQEWQSVFSQAQKVFDTLPLLVVAGNHESNHVNTYKPEEMLKYFTLPNNGPTGFIGEFYSFDYADCHFVGLNSNIYEQLENQKITQEDFARVNEWIRKDLSSSDKTWKIVFMHHPAYSVVNDATATQIMKHWAPMFEEALVDVVFCGHQHTYMRTKPMLNGLQNDAKGITYVMGNSGGKHYSAQTQSYADAMFTDISTYSVIQINGDKLTLETYDDKNNMLDSFTATARNRNASQTTGDVNGDGTLDTEDVRAIIRSILLRNFDYTLMDINEDGQVNVLDAHALSLKTAK